MKTTFLFLLLSATLLFAACRGRESMASKSAQAYEKAMQAGTPIDGDGHGGHVAPTAPDQAAMKQAAARQPADHAAMGQQAMDMGQDMPDHPGMRPGTAPAGQQQAAHAGTQQSEHAGQAMAQQTPMHQQQRQQQPAQMDHAAMGHAAPPVAASAGQRAFPISEAPASSSDMAQLRPSSTLSSDPQDTPARAAVGEAQKAAAAATGAHAGPGQTQPPQAKPPSHDHGSER